ncbi:hypothetical protein [Fischerella thermalis]|uniref:hypothetical protein n=1 Tax=Fischerella thermalis TaxID=372787 RepID=UPI001039E98C|nr:hypothetical protein [Fischerella thermalis]
MACTIEESSSNFLNFKRYTNTERSPLISSPANYLRYYCDAVGHWARDFSHYPLPITNYRPSQI